MTQTSTDIEAQVAALMAQTGLDEQTVRTMLTAMDQQAGEPIGTVRKDPATGAVAHRVKDRDVPKWRISHPINGMTYEMTPTKTDWTLVSSPEPE
ncbi:hypothetical protein FZI85_17180 [Mycobacterium sp. CBMA293]|uniref:hypothetical protein n=1 Tax=unclassified Mycolicibacterium TaxID=2636767 RepID=UPI0012DC0672|nr:MULTISPECIES: hypothetical protein [unclassified Mycolicibacterium]MUL44457.1 hypothetical protein [Mycolicibacterium sp. CBMA 360]MUL59777.1 hypothetical protein [Mycolicibacterium sp. CBMA 335]MUL68620.1 hypothetical protein [Mycolicibacterium sp. CBMA 311]MUL93989.1 hypothetical protein [Mycolicibacterium sp. CBMA 230]MUM06236.1 hypothetical protein [Mycolicibacterium sp. CBMA 213]